MNVIVVGGGITGVSAAEWLRRDGHEVVLIDRVSPGDPMQASYGNCGIVGRCSVVPISVPGLGESLKPVVTSACSRKSSKLRLSLNWRDSVPKTPFTNTANR